MLLIYGPRQNALALEERTRERLPLEWAATHNALGGALLRLGKSESGTAALERSILTYELALEEQTRERVPLYWADSRYGLAHALEAMAERTGDPAMLEKAIAAMADAAEIYKTASLDYWLPFVEQALARMRSTQAALGSAD